MNDSEMTVGPLGSVLHPVEGGVARAIAPLHRAGELDRATEQQQLLGDRGLARVRVRYDREAAAAGAVSWLKDIRLARSGKLPIALIEPALPSIVSFYCCVESAAWARTRSSAAARWLRLRRRPISSTRSPFFARLCQRYASSRLCGTPRPAR